MDLNKIKNYKVNESSVLNETDKKHINNYQQLIKFFENALANSIKDGKVDYYTLHDSCLQSIRYLDSLILSYDGAVHGVRMVNNTLDKIIADNKKEIKEGNDQEYQSQL
jgi:hypothetical protein